VRIKPYKVRKAGQRGMVIGVHPLTGAKVGEEYVQEYTDEGGIVYTPVDKKPTT
jgi:hypothetical protein